jgi:outer membrane protein assembly factor BamB
MKSDNFFLIGAGVLLLCLFIAVVPVSAAPVPAFIANITSGTAPLTVQFTDTSSGSPTGWAWYFGDENYKNPWTEVNASAGWTPRWDFNSVVTPDGGIVLIGGIDGIGPWVTDIWRSTDNGATWTEMNTSAGWTPRISTSSVAIPDGNIVMTGGHNSSSGSQTNETWRSTDNGATWTLQNASAAWPAREQHTSVAMPDGSIVLMGGADSSTRMNDVWRSMDEGVTWTLMNASAGWSGRQTPSSVAMPDGSIVLMGGYSNSGRMNDVWRSVNYGATWTRMTAGAAWTPRDLLSSVAMPDGSIVLMGGADGGYPSDVWRSIDNGATWTEVNASPGWIGRQTPGGTVAMPDGSIVLMGGTNNTFMNDVWQLRTTGSSLQNPLHRYNVSGIYQVSLQVYNNLGYNSIREPGYIQIASVHPPPPASQALFRNNLNRTGDFSNILWQAPTNNLRWKFTAPNVIHGSPTVANGVVYVGCNDTKLYALDASTGSPIWNYTTGGMVQSSPAVADGVVYVGSDNGRVSALNAATGTLIWENVTAGSNRVRSSPAVAYGNVYVGGDTLGIYAINQSTGMMTWANSTVGEVYSSPAVSNGVVYFGSYDGYVYAVDAMTGVQLWKFHTRGNPVLSTPAIYDNTVFIGGWDKDIYALSAATGAKVWNFTTGAPVQSSPVVANGIVYIGSDDHKVYALDANTKSEVWNFDTGGMVSSSPALANGEIIVGSYANKTYAINATTGVEIWNYTMDGFVYSSPAVADGTAYIGSWDHNLYALGGGLSGEVLDAVDIVAGNSSIVRNVSNETLSASPDPIVRGTVIKQWNPVKPSLTAPGEGYFVLVDEAPNANWEHPAKYVFVPKSGGIPSVVDASSPPDIPVTYAKGKIPNPEGGTVADPPGNCAVQDCSHCYALLISGGVNPQNNNIRYWTDISNMYTTLRSYYCYPPDHITVLLSDGQDAGKDRLTGYSGTTPQYDNSPTDFGYQDAFPDVNGAATYQNVVNNLTRLNSTLTSQDTLFIFTTNHGGNDTVPGSGNANLYLWNGETITDSDFVAPLKNSRAKAIMMTMGQCFGGGFSNDFMVALPPTQTGTQTRIFTSAANKDESSWGSAFNTPWIRGLNGFADQGRIDGVVSMPEAYNYAVQTDDYAVNNFEHPQFVTGGPANPDFMNLSACSRVTNCPSVVSVSGSTPRDGNYDCQYEDLNGDGHLTTADPIFFFNNMEWIATNEPTSAFDFNGNGRIDFGDVYKVYQMSVVSPY